MMLSTARVSEGEVNQDQKIFSLSAYLGLMGTCSTIAGSVGLFRACSGKKGLRDLELGGTPPAGDYRQLQQHPG